MRTIKVCFGLLNLDVKQKEKLKEYLDEMHKLYAPYFHIYYTFDKQDYINSIHGDLSVIIYKDDIIEERLDTFLIQYFGFLRLFGELEYLFADIKRFLNDKDSKEPKTKHESKKYFYYFSDSFNPITSVGEV